jgi:hypothetical protein
MAAAAIVLILGAAQVTTASGAGSHARQVIHCPRHTVEGPLGMETVLTTRNMACRTATRVVKRNDGEVPPRKAFRRHGHYRMGAFNCHVTKVEYESAISVCRDGMRRYKWDYGS